MQAIAEPRHKRSPIYEPGSFRDRNGRVFYAAGAVYRGLSAQALRAWEALSATKFFGRYLAEGKLIPTERVDPFHLVDLVDGEWAAVLKHQCIPFVSYPYEWSFGMLKDAALLQLELLDAALNEDLMLKDGSAFNVQWQGARPVFIDIPSLVRLRPGEPWLGYRQFCQMFLYPLFLQAYKNVPFQPWLRGSIDGIPADYCKQMMSLRDLFRPGVLLHVYLQAKLQARYGQTGKDIKRDLRALGFHKGLIQANVRRLQKIVHRLSWQPAQSEWSDYEGQNSYTDADRKKKEAFVRSAVQSRPWGLIWDLGCNTGTFSRIAAENARYVVALDADHLAIERFYQRLKAEDKTNILPLVMNLADASPGLGWRGLERRALTQRGRPDLTLCLALIHHLVIGANIPLREFIAWLADLETHLVIEFVTKNDPMVQTLLRNREDQFPDYELSFFEQSLAEQFNVIRREVLTSGTRMLYFATTRVR